MKQPVWDPEKTRENYHKLVNWCWSLWLPPSVGRHINCDCAGQHQEDTLVGIKIEMKSLKVRKCSLNELKLQLKLTKLLKYKPDSPTNNYKYLISSATFYIFLYCTGFLSENKLSWHDSNDIEPLAAVWGIISDNNCLASAIEERDCNQMTVCSACSLWSFLLILDLVRIRRFACYLVVQ